MRPTEAGPVRPTADGRFGPAITTRGVVIGAGFGGPARGVKRRLAASGTLTIHDPPLRIGGPGRDATDAVHVAESAVGHREEPEWKT